MKTERAHGTRVKYVMDRCRCDLCRQANREYARERNRLAVELAILRKGKTKPERRDWHLTTWEGNRRRQHEEFRRLSFREKLAVIEQLGEVSAFFAAKRRERIEREACLDNQTDPYGDRPAECIPPDGSA